MDCAACLGKANESYDRGISALNELTGPFPMCPVAVTSYLYMPTMHTCNVFRYAKGWTRFTGRFPLRYADGYMFLDGPSVNATMADHDGNSGSGLS